MSREKEVKLGEHKGEGGGAQRWRWSGVGGRMRVGGRAGQGGGDDMWKSLVCGSFSTVRLKREGELGLEETFWLR